MSNMQLVFTYDGSSAVTQQLVVMEQRTCYRILDGQHTDGCRVLLDLLKHLFEGTATDQLNLFALEIEVRRNIVERPYQSLYGYSLHNLLLHLLKKIPLSPK
jgi:hypothetical protein